jgi:alanine transaminase
MLNNNKPKFLKHTNLLPKKYFFIIIIIIMFLLFVLIIIIPTHIFSISDNNNQKECTNPNSPSCIQMTKPFPQLTLQTLNPNVIRAEYAVRGRVLHRAVELDKELKNNKLPFKEIIYCNIGNPQNLGQKPLSFARRVESLLINPELLSSPPSNYPKDVINRATTYLKMVKGQIGAYSESQGIEGVRVEVAKFITKRDTTNTNNNIPPADPNLIFLTSGASQGVEFIMRALIRNSQDSILVPIPQYPLYSALAALLDGHFQGYYLNEDDEWDLSMKELEIAITQARNQGKIPRAVVVINPGNPTGQTLNKDTMIQLVEFARQHSLVILADEVYQANVYDESKPFISFRQIVLQSPGYQQQQQQQLPQLVSFHSISKGVYGECGLRGGYFEMLGFSDEVRAQIYKMASIGLCPNVLGQFAVGLLVNPPQLGDPSYELYEQETNSIFQSLKRRALKLVQGLNKLSGIKAQPASGAMYAFPRISLPNKFVEEAKQLGEHPDTLYSLRLLEATGIVVVPGNGFGQRDGTFHFRSTILPPENKLDEVIERMSRFHEELMGRYHR